VVDARRVGRANRAWPTRCTDAPAMDGRDEPEVFRDCTAGAAWRPRRGARPRRAARSARRRGVAGAPRAAATPGTARRPAATPAGHPTARRPRARAAATGALATAGSAATGARWLTLLRRLG